MEESMKILYINHEKNLGGAARSLLGIMEEMINIGYDVYVLTPFKSGDFISTCKNIKEIKIISIKFYSCVRKNTVIINKYIDSIIIFLLSYVYNFFVAYKVSKTINDLKIDIIHTNSSIINIGNYISKFTHIPQIVHFREFVEEDFSWEFIPNRTTVMNNIKKYSNYQIFISKILNRKYSMYFDIKKQCCIYNGVTIKNNYLKKKDSQYLNIIIAGRVIEGKGQLEAVEAINILINYYKIKNIKLYIVGSCEENYTKLLKRKIDEYNLIDNVIFTGYLNNVNELRSRMEYELVCSKSEGFGRVVIEGMLSSNVMIVSNAGALPEIVTNGIDGFVYELGNYKQLANIILNCYNGKYDLHTIKQNAKNKCINKFSQRNNASEIVKIYQRLIINNENQN